MMPTLPNSPLKKKKAFGPSPLESLIWEEKNFYLFIYVFI